MNMPGYWRNETSGVLRPAIEAFLGDGAMTPEQIAAMRAYLRQWVAADWAPGDTLDMLRETVETLDTAAEISWWLEAATDFGIDPL